MNIATFPVPEGIDYSNPGNEASDRIVGSMIAISTALRPDMLT